MQNRAQAPSIPPAAYPGVFRLAAAVALLSALALPARAQSGAVQPAELDQQRLALFLKTRHASLADLEAEINHLARLAEACRVEQGAAACGLPDTSLGSGKLEDRYDYYIRRRVEARLQSPAVRFSRQNWDRSSAPTQK